MSVAPDIGTILRHVADQPVDAKRIKGLNVAVTGKVDTDGTILGGTGFSVVHSGTGIYAVTYDVEYDATPTTVVTAVNSSTRAGHIASEDETGFTVNMRSGTTLTDVAFNFITMATT